LQLSAEPKARMEAITMTESILRHVKVFESETDGYRAYRIPAIEMAADGTLLAFAEGRKHNLADPGGNGQTIDLVMKRSTDNGATWSDMRVIEAPGECWSAANPATLRDRDTGRIWLFYLRCRPGATSSQARPGTDDVRMLTRWSDDNGLTWSEPRDLTAIARDLNDSRWRCTVPGPGGAVQTRDGRLVVPCWKLEPWRNFVLFSSDHGATWERGEPVPGDVDGNENQTVELDNGHLLMDIRPNEGEQRWFAESADGGRTWSMPQPGIGVTRVACAITRTPAAGAGRGSIVWTGPLGPDRRDLAVRVSDDDARTFGPPRRIRESMAAYSDLIVLSDGTPGVLWECGCGSPYESLVFTRLPNEFCGIG
jgi:sialidase-1